MTKIQPLHFSNILFENRFEFVLNSGIFFLLQIFFTILVKSLDLLLHAIHSLLST